MVFARAELNVNVILETTNSSFEPQVALSNTPFLWQTLWSAQKVNNWKPSLTSLKTWTKQSARNFKQHVKNGHTSKDGAQRFRSKEPSQVTA